MQSRLITAAVLLTWAIAASGQASRSESAEADAAMERARRAAAGPLKAIQQAAKIRRRGDADAPAPLAATPAPAAVLAASSAVLPAAVATTERPAVDRVVAPPPALVLDDTPPALRVTEVAPLATPVAAAVVALPALAVARLVPDLPPAVPKLQNMLEPVIPPRLLLQEGRAVEVEVDMSLRADGTVESVTVLPPVPRAWQRHITAALEQWRFEPMSGPARHRVRLMFNTEPR